MKISNFLDNIIIFYEVGLLVQISYYYDIIFQSKGYKGSNQHCKQNEIFH